MRIPSGKTDQLIFFVAVDATDFVTRETALATFTVYRSRNGGVATVYTTPTVAELSAANMPGVYALTVDEDTTIAAGSDSEEYCVHITHAGMAPVTRTIELYRRDTTSGQTITVANGAADADIERLQGSVIATPSVAGVLEVDVTHWIGTAAATPTVAGVPEVDVTHFNGVAGTFAAGRPEVNTTHAAGTAWGSGAITAASIAADAITDAKVAADVTIASVTGAVGSVTGAVGSVTGNVGGNVVGSVGSVTGLTAANLDATVSSRATPAQVNTEVLDVLTVDTFAEPGQGAPAATTTLAAKINYLFKAWRNKKTQDATDWKLFADDAATVDQKSAVTDAAGTLTRGEIATGP